MASRSRGLAAHARASATPSASASASAPASATPAASASASPPAASGSGLSTVAGASGDPSLVSPAVKAQFNKLNCADKNWKKQVGYTAQQYNLADIQTVSCGSLGGVRVQVRAGQGGGAGQGHHVGQRHPVRPPASTGRPT